MTARVERVAATEATNRQPATFPHAMGLDCLQRIGRAARVKAAVGTQPWANEILVGANRAEQQIFHVRLPAASAVLGRLLEQSRVQRTGLPIEPCPEILEAGGKLRVGTVARAALGEQDDIIRTIERKLTKRLPCMAPDAIAVDCLTRMTFADYQSESSRACGASNRQQQEGVPP